MSFLCGQKINGNNDIFTKNGQNDEKSKKKNHKHRYERSILNETVLNVFFVF